MNSAGVAGFSETSEMRGDFDERFLLRETNSRSLLTFRRPWNREIVKNTNLSIETNFIDMKI